MQKNCGNDKYKQEHNEISIRIYVLWTTMLIVLNGIALELLKKLKLQMQYDSF